MPPNGDREAPGTERHLLPRSVLAGARQLDRGLPGAAGRRPRRRLHDVVSPWHHLMLPHGDRVAGLVERHLREQAALLAAG